MTQRVFFAGVITDAAGNKLVFQYTPSMPQFFNLPVPAPALAPEQLAAAPTSAPGAAPILPPSPAATYGLSPADAPSLVHTPQPASPG